MFLDELAQYLRDGGVPAAAVADVGGGNFAITVGLPAGADGVLMLSANAAAVQQISPTTEFDDGFALVFYGDTATVAVPPDCVLYICEEFTGHGEPEAEEASQTIQRLLAEIAASVPA